MFQYLVYHDGLPGKIRWKDSWILQHLPLCDSVFIFANGKLNLQYSTAYFVLFCFVSLQCISGKCIADLPELVFTNR
jgi:hypothetical protein